MADGDWTAEPDEITVPPDAADTDPRLYIGPNDPMAAAILGQNNNAIMFYWADRRAFMIFSEDNGPDFGALRIWSVDDQTPGGRLIQWIELFHDVNDPEFAPSMVIGGNDLIYSIAVDAQHTIDLQVGQKDGHPGTPTLRLNGQAEVDGTEDPDLIAYGVSLPRGKRNAVITTVSSAAIGAETSVATLPNFTYRAGRAYEMRIIGIGTMSVATNTAQFRIKKTNTAGQQLANYGNWSVSTTTGEPIHQTGRVFTVGAADVTATLILSAQASAGTVTINAGALFPRKVEIWDCGAASDFPTEPVLV